MIAKKSVTKSFIWTVHFCKKHTPFQDTFAVFDKKKNNENRNEVGNRENLQ